MHEQPPGRTHRRHDPARSIRPIRSNRSACSNRSRRSLEHLLAQLRTRSAGRAGFTLIEILVAVVIIVIGLVGVMAMQIVAIQANANARSSTEATNVAEHFVTVLQQDATRWQAGTDTSQTNLIAPAITDAGSWRVASSEPVNVLGVQKSNLIDKEKGRAKYCVGYVLDWGVTGQVISGFVTVYWPRIGGDAAFANCFDNGDGTLDLAGLQAQGGRVGIVTLPLTLRRTHVD